MPYPADLTRRNVARLGLFLLLVHAGLVPYAGLALCVGADGHVALTATHGCCDSPAEPVSGCRSNADLNSPTPDTGCVAANGCLNGTACSGGCLDIPVDPSAARLMNDADPDAKKLAAAPGFWRQAMNVIQTSSADLARTPGDIPADPMRRQLQTVVLLS